MKTAAKVFLWISIVGGFITFIVFMITAINLNMDLLKESLGSKVSDYTAEQLEQLLTASKVISWVYAICGLVPVILGGVSIWRLNVAKRKSQLIVWGILDILFCGLVSGILILCIPESDFEGEIYNGPYKSVDPDIFTAEENQPEDHNDQNN